MENEKLNKAFKVTLGSTGRYNFHHVRDINIIVKPDNIVSDSQGKYAKLTSSQLRRIQKHYCGVSDCTCGSGPDGLEFVGPDIAIIRL